MRSLLLTTTLAIASSAAGATPVALPRENPFHDPSALPYRLPPFDRIVDADYRPAYEAGMRAELKEVRHIAHDARPADFQNTIVALERSGELLDRVSVTFQHLNSCNTDPEMQKIDAEMAPRLAAHEDAILLDPALYARVDSLYGRRADLGLDPESLQLLERYHTHFVRAGAGLSEASKAQLRALNQELSELTTRFKQNVLKATADGAVVVDSVAELDGLSQEQIGAASQAAAARGLTGKWLIALQNTTSQPALAQIEDRGLRERIYRASIGRAASGATDNTPVIAKLVKLRAERAALLGYPNHAAYVLADESAGTAAAVHDILSRLTPKALARAKQDAAEMQKLVDADAAAHHREPFALQAWDWPFYAEKLRKARYAYDQSEVAPYFELNRVLQQGVFYAAHELYGLTFKERFDLPAYHPDVRIFEVFDADGKPLALFLADYFARDNKEGGAWMNSYVRQSKLFNLKPVVANHLNIPKPQAGQPALLSFDEVTTMFHEFGHAIHGMLSNVRYPLLSGVAVPRDFAEYPSQFNEMWAQHPAVVAHYARHHVTGKPMPPELLSKVLASQKFNQGYASTEYLAAAVVDQEFYVLDAAHASAAADVPAFEAEALRKNGLDFAPVPPRYHSTYFSHVFSLNYSAAYYAYLWSEVLARDTGAWVQEHGGLTRANGDTLRDKVLSRGRTANPESLFESLYGRAPEIGPLLEYRGLTSE